MQKISSTEAETLSCWRFYNLKLSVSEKPVWVGLSCFCFPPENFRVKSFKAMLIECFKDNFDMKLSISTSEKNPTKSPIAVKIHVHLGKQRAQIHVHLGKRALANRTYLETLLATFVSKLINYIIVRSLGCSACIISSRFSPISVCFGQNKLYIITNNFPALKRPNTQRKVP